MNTTHAQTSLASRSRAAIQGHVRNGLTLHGRSSFLVLLLPATVATLVVLLSRTPFLWLAEKATQEIVAPSILAVAVVIASLFWARAGHFYSRWLLLVTAGLFCRELHFVGTENGIYVVILALVWYASRHMDGMQPMLEHRTAASLFVGALVTYLISKTFDRAYWSFLAGWSNWQDTIEESLESTAHLMILSLVVVSYVAWGIRSRRSAVAATSANVRRLRWGLLAAAIAAGTFATLQLLIVQHKPGRPRGEFPIELSSLCSVSPNLGPNLFLASSDEEPKLVLWSLNEAGRPAAIKNLQLLLPQTDGSALHLDDLEDIAWDGRDTYYAVTSHRHLLPQEDRSRRKKSHGTECTLASFKLAATDAGIVVSNARIITQELLASIRELGVFPSIDWNKSKVFSWRSLATTWQLDIEGLAFVDGRLLLGFKNPIEDGHATILSYDPATDALAVAARLDLGGHGILGLHFDPESDRLFLLSNDPLKHRFGDSCLWWSLRGPDDSWSFSPTQRVTVEPASAKTRRKASGVTVRQDKIAVCFDSETESPIDVFARDEILSRR